LRGARVIIVGVGCDGGLAAIILARMGVGHLTLVDPDVVEVSNLNRQPLCTVSTLGAKKVAAGKQYLHDCNPTVSVSAVDCAFTESSSHLLTGHDVALQCVDNFEARVAIHRAGREVGIPVVSMTGQPPYRAHVMTFLAGGPEYEEVWALPSLGRDISSKVSEKLRELKRTRAQHAGKHGASPGWCERFVANGRGWGDESVGWGITPERAYLTATIQAHEAVNVICRRKVLAVAPTAVVIDLCNAPHLMEVVMPPDGVHWSVQAF
jgi:molybdopterin-synthase adenylyltransferase